MKSILTFALLFLGISTSSAQIVMTASDFRTANLWNATTYSNSTDLTGASTILAHAGENQTWDFSKITYSPEAAGFTNAHIIPYSTSLPLATDADFTTATDVLTGTSSDLGGASLYEYLRITDEGLWLLGVVAQGTKFVDYSAPVQILKFPLTYQTTWTSTYDQTIALDPGTVTHSSSTMVADGWGTIVLPQTSGLSGTSFPAIRVRTTTVEIVTTQGSTPDTTRSYKFDWYTKTGVGASISATSDQTANSMSYSVPTASAIVREANGDAFRMQFSQNPAANSTFLSYSLHEPSVVNIQIMDMLGNSVRTVQNAGANSGANRIGIDAADLANGTYFVRLTTNGQRAMRRLVIVK